MEKNIKIKESDRTWINNQNIIVRDSFRVLAIIMALFTIIMYPILAMGLNSEKIREEIFEELKYFFTGRLK